MAIPKLYIEKRGDRTTNLAINLKYSFHGMRLEYFTGIRVDDNHFVTDYWSRNGNPIKSTAPKAEDLNEKLNIILGHVRTAENKALAAGTPLSVEYFRDYLNKQLKEKPEDDTHITIFKYFDQFIEEMRNGINQKTGVKLSKANIEKYSAVKSMLEAFVKHRGAPIDFGDFDKKLYDELIIYMINEKKYALNTYGRHIKFIKTVLHKATRDGINTNIKYQNSFVGVTEPSDNAYLTDEELDLIYKKDFSASPYLDRVRDIFLIGCYTGLRFSDYTNLLPEHIVGDRIKIVTQKTRQQVIIPMHPRVKAILEKYHFHLPPPISNQKFNTYIQKVCKKAEINEPYTKNITRAGVRETISGKKYEFISSHSARRTFATNAYKRKIAPFLIMAITGHKTEAEFLKYIKITGEERAQMFEEMAKW